MTPQIRFGVPQKTPAILGARWGLASRGPPSACRRCTGKLIEADRSAVGLQTVCVLYFGDVCVGDNGRSVIARKRGQATFSTK